jgi:hypothetical protein
MPPNASIVYALSKAVNCLVCCSLGQQVNLHFGKSVEMGWPDIHWLARDKGGLVAAVLWRLGFQVESADGACVGVDLVLG